MHVSIIACRLINVHLSKAAEIYASLKSQGNLISDADILVAAIAVSNNLVLITNNTSHFTRVEGLKVENWKA